MDPPPATASPVVVATDRMASPVTTIVPKYGAGGNDRTGAGRSISSIFRFGAVSSKISIAFVCLLLLLLNYAANAAAPHRIQQNLPLVGHLATVSLSHCSGICTCGPLCGQIKTHQLMPLLATGHHRWLPAEISREPLHHRTKQL